MWALIALLAFKRFIKSRKLLSFSRNPSEMLTCGQIGEHQEMGLRPQRHLLVVEAAHIFANLQKLL